MMKLRWRFYKQGKNLGTSINKPNHLVKQLKAKRRCKNALLVKRFTQLKKFRMLHSLCQKHYPKTVHKTQNIRLIINIILVAFIICPIRWSKHVSKVFPVFETLFLILPPRILIIQNGNFTFKNKKKSQRTKFGEHSDIWSYNSLSIV